ncbi:MAG: hypothetical protein ABI574_13865 [Burkholderiales bacterium]
MALYPDESVKLALINSPQEAAEVIASWPQDFAGVFYTANRVGRLFDGRITNEAIERVTALVVDIDATRPTKTNATQTELAAVVQVGWFGVIPFLNQHGISDVRAVCTGNGMQIFIRVDLPNNGTTRQLIKAFLKALAVRFNTPGVTVDLSVSNAARYVRVPMTVNRKGPHSEERPWRIAALWRDFEQSAPTSAETLASIAGPREATEEVTPGAASHTWDELPADEQQRKIEDIQSALPHLDPDDRAEWVAAGRGGSSLEGTRRKRLRAVGLLVGHQQALSGR